jgi:hypothetical protein
MGTRDFSVEPFCVSQKSYWKRMHIVAEFYRWFLNYSPPFGDAVITSFIVILGRDARRRFAS